MPKGFGKNYFTLVAIQAYISMQKIIAMCASASTLGTRVLLVKINSPPPSLKS
jgi:hypothetical protein